MHIAKLVSSLPLGTILVVTPAFGHGPDHARTDSYSATGAKQVATVDERFDPTYILAAVCSLHGRHDPGAFDRRVEFIKLARADMKSSANDDGPPLYDNLGELTYPITTENALAQRYFDQGLRLAYGFNHYEALRSFRKAQQLDPDCAMCYWGEAWVLGPNINAPMEPAAMAPAVGAVEKAVVRSRDVKEREQALIAALGKRYSTDPGTEQAVRNKAYADAMATVAAKFPEDADIGSMYADALMNLSPWDYWEADGRTLKPAVAELANILESALAKAPDHPYAIHLYIHTMEASNTPERAEPQADRLGALVPGAGHLVHMPFHIYFNIGRFGDAIDTNRSAVAADEAYLAQASANDVYAYGYYPHNVHSLLESARMAGDADTTLAAAEKLPKVMSEEMAAQVPWVQVIYVAPLFAHAQFSDPRVTLAIADPGDRFPYVRAMWHYSRGVAQAARGDVKAAQDEATAIAIIEDSTDFSGLTQGGVPAPDLLRLARHVLAGRIAQAQGDYVRAAQAFSEAVAIQDALPYLEPPFWYYPVRQSLGAALLQAGQTEEAEQVFRLSLEKTPNNGWAIFGLMRALEARGDMAGVEALQARLAQAWMGDRTGPELGQL